MDKKAGQHASYHCRAQQRRWHFWNGRTLAQQKILLLTAPLGDGGEAWVYNVKDGKLHKIEGGFGLGEMGWLEDSRIMLHQGCVLATHCKKLESVNNKTPWLVEVTEDLGKKK